MAKDKAIFLGGDGYWFNTDDSPICGRRRKHCDLKKEGCGHIFTKEEHDLWECPECGKDRRCRAVAGFGTTFEGEPGVACKFHGGSSLRGAENPAYIHGDYSKYLPSKLAAQYEEFIDDPRRLSLEREMALIRTLVADRALALDKVNSAEAWIRLDKTFAEMMSAQRQKQNERFAALLLQLGDIIEEGTGAASTRKEIMQLTEQERRLVDAQRQLYIDMGEFITRGMAITMFGRFMEAVKENVLTLPGGATALTAISGSIRGMVGDVRGGGSGSRAKEIDTDVSVAE